MVENYVSPKVNKSPQHLHRTSEEVTANTASVVAHKQQYSCHVVIRS